MRRADEAEDRAGADVISNRSRDQGQINLCLLRQHPAASAGTKLAPTEDSPSNQAFRSSVFADFEKSLPARRG